MARLTEADYARLEAEEPQVTRCEICGEEISEEDQAHGNIAEMYDGAKFAEVDDTPGKVVHYECGKARGWEIA